MAETRDDRQDFVFAQSNDTDNARQLEAQYSKKRWRSKGGIFFCLTLLCGGTVLNSLTHTQLLHTDPSLPLLISAPSHHITFHKLSNSPNAHCPLPTAHCPPPPASRKQSPSPTPNTPTPTRTNMHQHLPTRRREHPWPIPGGPLHVI